MLSPDGTVLIFVVTHVEALASPEQHEELVRAIGVAVEATIEDSDVRVTVAGFAAMRAEIVHLLRRDQIVINGSGIVIWIPPLPDLLPLVCRRRDHHRASSL